MAAKKTTGKIKPAIKGLEKHRQRWRWRTSFEGRRLTFNLQAKTEAEAVVEVTALRKNPAIYSLGAWMAEAEAYVSQGLASRKLSAHNGKTRLTVLKLIGRTLGVQSPRQVTVAMLHTWLAGEVERLPEGSTSPGSYLRHLKAFFKHLHTVGKISANPAAEIAMPTTDRNLRDVFLPAGEVRRLLDEARKKGDRDLEFILVLGCECGMRRSEISACRPEWFDLKVGAVTIPVLDGRFARKGRSGRRREATIPLSGAVLELISHHGLPGPYVIAPEAEWGDNIYRVEFRKRLGNFFRKHGWGHATAHDMRRSFGSNRVSAGVSIEKVANWMGIDVETAWRHYARFIPADDEINKGAALKPVVAAESLQETAVPVPAKDLKSALREVKELFEEGLITAEDAAMMKARILKG